MTNITELSETIGMLMAQAGTQDALEGLEPVSSEYWYLVAYYMVAKDLSVDRSMEYVKLLGV